MSRFLILLALVVVTGCATQRPIDSVRDRGDFQFRRGNYAAAAQEYTEITQRYPGDWRAQYRLGLCLLEVGKPDKARRALEIARDGNPRDNRIVDALAEAMYEHGVSTELFAFLAERAQAMRTVEDYLRLGDYAMKLGDPDSAHLAFETAIALNDGRSVRPYLAAAEFAEFVGDQDAAVRWLQQAYNIDPRDRRVLRRLRDLGEVPGPTLAMPSGQ